MPLRSSPPRLDYQCRTCSAIWLPQLAAKGSREAKQVWLNRRAPVFTEGRKRKWQEFYQCECDTVWWGWSSDRPPLDLSKKSDNSDPESDN